MTPPELKYDANGLLTVVIQHATSGQVLMVGFANQEAVRRTLDTGKAWFFSRARQSLWLKGETSGNELHVQGIRADCDGDALVYLCHPAGPTCHTGEPSCFFEHLDGRDPGETSGEAASMLWSAIQSRKAEADTSTSYVARLLAQGVDRIAKKIGEEAGEVIIAAKNADRAEVAHEVADLWFHTYLLLAQQGMTPEDVWEELRSRRH
ncbi:MAG: bifunctional phosphoribosyl-AMP cyclohydrolase/phosphoribosyl-ATP diphosphatase HisIE [Chloroflexi bacterium]|nr:bifunctional phosphoribosyl-AMP cyclohydrolase/phosphoribosyl-ATP diphosphatase HisIE [Chloroflexota bacterium]